MNRDFLIQLQWHTVLSDWTWILFHLWIMLYQGPEGSSTPGKPVSLWRQVNVPAIYTESNHEYRLSDPTTVVHSTDWLDLNIFPPAEDALSRTRRFINTWKTGFTMKASQCSGGLYWIKPWIETFWSNYSGTQYWLTGPEHFLPAEDALSRTRRFINTWKTGFAMKASQCSGGLYWIKPWIETFWSNYSGTQ